MMPKTIKDCIFCKITKGEIPAFKIWENNEFLAILDLNPNTPGMTVLLTKDHYDSYLQDMPDEVYQRFWLAAKKVSQLLDKKLGTKRTGMVLEGMGVNHAHVKLYPFHKLEEKWPQEAKKEVFYYRYPGFIDTRKGAKVNLDELKKIADKISNHQ